MSFTPNYNMAVINQCTTPVLVVFNSKKDLPEIIGQLSNFHLENNLI